MARPIDPLLVLHSLVGLYDGDEVVDEYTHALQCADSARRDGAGPELVVAALFHDIARSPQLPTELRELPHESAAARWLRPWFGEHVAFLAGAHVLAKLYLIDSEPGYAASLSAESRASASLQLSAAGSFPSSDPWWPDALRLRRWDDRAKDPAAPAPDEAPFLELAISLSRA